MNRACGQPLIPAAHNLLPVRPLRSGRPDFLETTPEYPPDYEQSVPPIATPTLRIDDTQTPGTRALIRYRRHRTHAGSYPSVIRALDPCSSVAKSQSLNQYGPLLASWSSSASSMNR